MFCFFQMINDDKAEIFMYVENLDGNDTYDVEIEVDLSSGLLIDFGTLDYIKHLPNNHLSDIINIVGLKYFTWAVGNLTSKYTVSTVIISNFRTGFFSLRYSSEFKINELTVGYIYLVKKTGPSCA